VEGADGAATGCEWDGHLLLLHDSDAERHAAVAAWVQRGLGLGECAEDVEDELAA
jgi:hypothetical protein